MSSTDPIIWNEWIERLRGQLSPEIFNRHFSGMELVGISGDCLKVALPAGADLATLSRAYGGILDLTWSEAVGKDQRVELAVGGAQAAPEPSPAAEAADFIPGVSLNPDFTFETFVEGNNNSYAVAAAHSVAEQPGGPFNPLLIYGGSGLGKTHLLHAIGNAIHARFPEKTIRCITANDFSREYVDNIRRSDNENMRRSDGSRPVRPIDEMDDFYRHKVDVLLMDDIQFLASGEATQIQLFHIFNELYGSRKQIVLTSDKPVSELEGLEERLVTRFQGGLSLDVQPPDVEMREAILRNKLQRMDRDLSDEIIRAIAMRVAPNIRMLEQVLRQLLFAATCNKCDITPELVDKVLGSIGQSARGPVTASQILGAVCAEFHIDESRILEKGRGTQEAAGARMVAMYLMRKLTKMSLKSVGNYFSGRDHSTVVSAVNNVEKSLEADPGLRRSVDNLMARLR